MVPCNAFSRGGRKKLVTVIRNVASSLDRREGKRPREKRECHIEEIIPLQEKPPKEGKGKGRVSLFSRIIDRERGKRVRPGGKGKKRQIALVLHVGVAAIVV